jgi:hypothetical protein
MRCVCKLVVIYYDWMQGTSISIILVSFNIICNMRYGVRSVVTS